MSPRRCPECQDRLPNHRPRCHLIGHGSAKGACPRCLELARQGTIRTEMVQPLPDGAWAPLAVDGSGRCCFDCASADTVVRLKILSSWEAARVATGNERLEQLRLPGAPMGLVRLGYVKPSEPGELDAHHRWLDSHRWFGIDLSREG